MTMTTFDVKHINIRKAIHKQITAFKKENRLYSISDAIAVLLESYNKSKTEELK